MSPHRALHDPFTDDLLDLMYHFLERTNDDDDDDENRPGVFFWRYTVAKWKRSLLQQQGDTDFSTVTVSRSP